MAQDVEMVCVLI